jgi:hypothetical protein
LSSSTTDGAGRIPEGGPDAGSAARVTVEVHGCRGPVRVAEIAKDDEQLRPREVAPDRASPPGGRCDVRVLNIGDGFRPGRRPLYKNISANAEELEAMRELERQGTRVEMRIVADDRPVAFSSVDKGG